MAMTLPLIAYFNYYTTVPVSALIFSGTVVPGFEPAHAVDGYDYTIFECASGDTLDVDLTGVFPTEDITFMSAWIAPRSVSTDIELWVDSGAGFALVESFVIPANQDYMKGKITGIQVTPLNGVSVRFVIGDGAGPVVRVRQLFAGTYFRPPVGQHVGITPPNLTQGVIVDQVISVNGSLIGRNLRRMERKTSIELEYLSPVWVRDTWDPFIKAAIRFPFWYKWDPDGHDDEMVFASVEEIRPPENSRVRGLMSVSAPLYCLAARIAL